MTSLPFPSRWRNDVIRILLVGGGGTGSHLLTGLARMHAAMLELGHPGLKVALCDPDRVSRHNVGRQLFSPQDVGRFKSDALIQRVNLFFGLQWVSHPAALSSLRHVHADLLIGCVDTAAARRCIARVHDGWWLDCGNDARTGQVILGGSRGKIRSPLIPVESVPTVLDLYPALRNPRLKEANAPSCSMAESLRRQDLFINQAVATAALDLLWDWFRRDRLTAHGVFLNLESKTSRPLPLDPALWARMSGGTFPPKPKTKTQCKTPKN